MARLPQPGSDNGTWGDILNEYLSQVHKSDGTLKDNSVTSSVLAPNSVTNAAIATDAVNATSIADGSITETLLDSGVQTKLNATGDWSTLSNKPAVIAAGADAAAARAVVDALGLNDIGTNFAPENAGAVGDGTTDDTAAFITTYLTAIEAVLRRTYRLDQLTITNEELRGEHYNVLKAATTNPVLRMRTGSTIDNVTIDGELSGSRRIDVGAAGNSNISARNVVLIDCPANSFRVIDDTSAVRLINIYAENSKVFNTEDDSTATNLLFSGIICLDSPFEAFLLDFPDSTPEWTGFALGPSIWESSTDTKRPIGFARAYGGVCLGQVIKGALKAADPTTSDLIHVEDKAQMIAIIGNVMETNGSYHAIDGAATGAGVQADQNPKELLYTSNLMKATDSNTSHLVWLEGTLPEGFEKVTVSGEMMLSNGVAKPMQVLATSGIYGKNYIYDAPAPENIRASDSITTGSTDNSAIAVNIIRPPSYHVEPKFLRGDHGHGYNPNDVIFRTSFGFSAYTGASVSTFQTWANSVKTITGATITTFGGSLGTGGTITFPIDPATGAVYLRATRGSTAMTSRVDLIWAVQDVDFQNLDSFCVRLLTRSSVQNAGKLTMEIAGGPSVYTQILNDGSDYASWKADGGSKVAPSTADLHSAARSIKCSIYFGDGLVNPGDTCDFGALAVSINRATPF